MSLMSSIVALTLYVEGKFGAPLIMEETLGNKSFLDNIHLGPCVAPTRFFHIVFAITREPKVMRAVWLHLVFKINSVGI